MNASTQSVSLARLHEENRVLVTAHRGASLEYPENTLLSMGKAVEAGADFIEFDLRATKDNVPVLLHDRTLKRTADADCPPEDMTLAEVKTLNASWFRLMHRFDAPLPEKAEVPTFEEVLDAFSDKVAMNIQIYLPTPASLAETCRLYRQYDMYDKGYMTIAGEDVVEAVRAIDRDIAICLTPGWKERVDEGNMRRCAELGCRWFQPVRETLTAEKLALARELGLRANCFFADSEVAFASLHGIGTPGIMTNAPARLVDWLAKIEG
jgi:glycerophosphoryl diester phosphodiesterase